VSGGAAQEEGEVAQTMYTHVSKCKNDKRKKEKSVCAQPNMKFNYEFL
jgi:hypothetical protein